MHRDGALNPFMNLLCLLKQTGTALA